MEYGSIAREYVYIIGEVIQQSRYTLPFEHRGRPCRCIIGEWRGVVFDGEP